MTGRLIAIGDIHGCYQEFSDLIAKLELQNDDQLILLGDLLNRGPDSRKVIELAREHRAISLLGNHELRLLNYRRTKDENYFKAEDAEALEKLQPDDWAYLEAMPLTHSLEELQTVLVHGGFLPNEPWQKQPAQVVTRIQVIDREGRPRKRAECENCPPWADLWNGPPFVVYGHTPRREIYKLKWSVGIDTGCVLGGNLTAYILPERRFVQVKARKAYYS